MKQVLQREVQGGEGGLQEKVALVHAPPMKEIYSFRLYLIIMLLAELFVFAFGYIIFFFLRFLALFHNQDVLNFCTAHYVIYSLEVLPLNSPD